MTKIRIYVQAFATAILCVLAPLSRVASATSDDMKPLASLRFTADEDVKCLSDAIETGNPESGPSTLLLKATPGCVVPWHHHTAAEQLMVIRGRVLTEMVGHPEARLLAGGFAAMASHVPHRFVCEGKMECLMMVVFDRRYDIFWGK